MIPLVALLVGGWVAMHYLMERGPTITIEFANADGLEAGKTKLRYKEVDIGTVSAIAIAKDRSHVIVTAKMAKQAEDLLVADTKFWVVRPRVTLNSISGLGTLLSGAYIGLDAGKSDEGIRLQGPGGAAADSVGPAGTAFHAACRRCRLAVCRRAGVLPPGGSGQHHRLQARRKRQGHHAGSIHQCAARQAGHDQCPLLACQRHRRVDRVLGREAQHRSLTSIIVGGISFQAPDETAAGDPAQPDTMFPLYDNKASALKLISREVHSYVLYFDESLRGLAPGAQVDFRGIPLGEVKSVSIEYDREDKVVRFPVEIDIYPERMRARYRPGSPEMSAMERNPQQLLDRMVARGFRAQLKSANLLTGQLYVALDFFPKAPKARIDWSKKPLVELPTAPGALEDIQQTLGNIAGKLEKVPFDTIGNDLSRALKTLDTTLKSANSTLKQVDTSIVPELRGTLESARKALGNAERTLASDAPVQSDLRDTLTEVTRAARTLQDLADYLSRHPESLIRGKKGD